MSAMKIKSFGLRATLLCLTLAVAGLVTGCASLRDSLFRPVLATNHFPAVTLTNVQPVTAESVEAAEVHRQTPYGQTVKDTVLTTNIFTTYVTNIWTLPSASTVVTNGFERRPEMTGVLDEIGLIVPGYGGLVSAGLGLASSLWLAWLNRRNSKAAKAFIAGIEDVRLGLQQSEEGRKIDAGLVAILNDRKVQQGAAVAEYIERLVSASTGNTTNGNVLRDALAALKAAGKA